MAVMLLPTLHNATTPYRGRSSRATSCSGTAQLRHPAAAVAATLQARAPTLVPPALPQTACELRRLHGCVTIMLHRFDRPSALPQHSTRTPTRPGSVTRRPRRNGLDAREAHRLWMCRCRLVHPDLETSPETRARAGAGAAGAGGGGAGWSC